MKNMHRTFRKKFYLNFSSCWKKKLILTSVKLLLCGILGTSSNPCGHAVLQIWSILSIIEAIFIVCLKPVRFRDPANLHLFLWPFGWNRNGAAHSHRTTVWPTSRLIEKIETFLIDIIWMELGTLYHAPHCFWCKCCWINWSGWWDGIRRDRSVRCYDMCF